MRDVTAVLDHYRNTVRTIWNVGFWPDEELRNWDAFEQFEQVCRLLFDTLVLAKLELQVSDQDVFRKPITELRIVPTSVCGCPIMIQGKVVGTWDDPVNRIMPDEAMLCFIDFFDWNAMNYIDRQYYRTRINAFQLQPHLVGKDALIEWQYVRVLLSADVDPFIPTACRSFSPLR